jgi:hypothetical protein
MRQNVLKSSSFLTAVLFLASLALTLGGCPGLTPGTDTGSGTDKLTFGRTVIDTAASGGATAVMAADFDGDGKMDLVSAWNTPGTVRLHLQQKASDGTITWNSVTLASGSLAAGAQAVAVADIDQDGRPDILVATSQGRILYLRQRGADSASPANWDISVIGASEGLGFDSWSDVQAVDVDGDGQLELVATLNSPGGRVCIFDPKAARPTDGSNWTRVDVATNGRNGANQVIPIDMDGDGNADLLTIARGEGSDSIVWYANPGKAVALTNLWVRHAVGHVDDPSAMALAYIDSDTFADIVVSSGSGKGIWGFQAPTSKTDLMDLTKRWSQHAIASFGADKGSGIYAGDLDGDGVTEIVAGTTGTGRLSVYKFDAATQAWVEKVIDDTPGNYGRVLIVDLDLNGTYDVVAPIDATNSQVVWYPHK